jgi:hypothetical protein
MGRHVAHMSEVKNAYEIWSETLMGRDHFEDLSLDGRIILEWILKKSVRMVGTGVI